MEQSFHHSEDSATAPGRPRFRITIFSNFLDLFQQTCTARNSLDGERWTDGFYSLCLMSIIRSLLADDALAEGRLHKALGLSYASQISTMEAIYKSLVSIFCWSSRCPDSHLDTALHSTRSFVDLVPENIIHCNKWKERGISSLRQYLTTLGGARFADGTYHGFLAPVNSSKKLLAPKPRSLQPGRCVRLTLTPSNISKTIQGTKLWNLSSSSAIDKMPSDMTQLLSKGTVGEEQAKIQRNPTALDEVHSAGSVLLPQFESQKTSPSNSTEEGPHQRGRWGREPS